MPAQDEIIQEEIERINNMTHLEMARLWRFGPAHPYFNPDLPYFKVFKERFDKFGGMTPLISKQIGW